MEATKAEGDVGVAAVDTQAQAATELELHTLRYGVEATKLVVSGFRSMNSRFKLAQDRGVVSKGRYLSEMIN